MSPRAEGLVLLALVALAIMGLHWLAANWRAIWQRYVAAIATVTRPRQAGPLHVRQHLFQPILFAGFYTVLLVLWIVITASFGMPVILLALLIVFPGSVLAYHAARMLARVFREMIS